MTGLWACVALCAVATLSSALPLIEVRTGDTDGGPEMRLKMVAVPVLQEINIPDAAVFLAPPQPPYFLQQPICGDEESPSQGNRETGPDKTNDSGGGTGPVGDVGAAKAVTVYV